MSSEVSQIADHAPEIGASARQWADYLRNHLGTIREKTLQHVAEHIAAATRAAQTAVESEVETIARALYARRFPNADVQDHFEWYLSGFKNPNSCVHYSTVAEAFRDARAAVLARAQLSQRSVDDAALDALNEYRDWVRTNAVSGQYLLEEDLAKQVVLSRMQPATDTPPTGE